MESAARLESGARQESASDAHGALRAVLRARLLLGLYYSGGQPRRRLLARLYCLALTYILIFIQIIIITQNNMSIYPFFAIIIEYITNVLTSFLTGEKQLFEFLKVIEEIDSKIDVNIPSISPATKHLNFIVVIYSILYSVFYTLFFVSYDMIAFCLSVAIVSLTNHLCRVNIIVPLNMIGLRVKGLRLHLEGRLDRENLSSARKVEVIYDCLRMYKSCVIWLTDTFSWAKILVVVSVASSFFRFLLTSYDMVWMLKTGIISYSQSCYIGLDVVVASAVSCAPAMFCELLYSEVDDLKLSIGNLLLHCDDGEVRAALGVAARYLRRRSARVTVTRGFALDASLALAYVSLSSTYLTVILQYAGAA